MIQEETLLEVIDNSGVKIVKCIKVLGGTRKRFAYEGDIVVCSVRKVINISKIKKGSVVRCLIVRTKTGKKRNNGIIVKFLSNSCVIVDNKGEMVAKSINGIISKALKVSNYKVATLAKELI